MGVEFCLSRTMPASSDLMVATNWTMSLAQSTLAAVTTLASEQMFHRDRCLRTEMACAELAPGRTGRNERRRTMRTVMGFVQEDSGLELAPTLDKPVVVRLTVPVTKWAKE